MYAPRKHDRCGPTVSQYNKPNEARLRVTARRDLEFERDTADDRTCASCIWYEDPAAAEYINGGQAEVELLTSGNNLVRANKLVNLLLVAGNAT